MFNQKQYMKLWREKHLSSGICPRHVQKGYRIVSGQERCQICIDKESTRYKERKLLSKCPTHPENDCLMGKTICKKCSDRGKSYRKKLRFSGMCEHHPYIKAENNRSVCQECRVIYTNLRKELKKEIFDFYGNKCFCPCGCKEDRIYFLTLAHVNNDGKKHREEIGKSGTALIRWIKNNNFPNTIRLECWNCNCSKRLNDCPNTKD